MFGINPIVAAALMVPLFAIADRGVGGGFGWNKTWKLPGRPLYYFGLGSLIFTTLIGGWIFGIAALVWCLYRSMAMKSFGGSLSPSTNREYVGTFFHHLVAGAVAIPLLFSTMVSGWWHTAALAPVYAGLATVLAAHESDSDNNVIESVRGGLFGMILGAALI